MERPTDEQLAAIRERCDRATEGPWKEYGCYVAQDGLIVAEAYLKEAEDVEFIAHAREDVPMLLAEVERLRKALGNIEALSFCRDLFEESTVLDRAIAIASAEVPDDYVEEADE